MTAILPERRYGMDEFNQRLLKVESDIVEVKEKLHALDEIREILSEGRAAFKFAGRCARGIRWAAKWFLIAIAPGVTAIGFFYSVTHNGAPPPWLEHWVNLFRG